MIYYGLLGVHVTTALISISFFLVRARWKLQSNPRLQQRWVKILPHVNDTVLLLAGISLAFSIQQSPFIHPWLMAKIIALLLYIFLGMMVMKGNFSNRVRLILVLLATMVFIYMLGVAVSKQANWFFL